jgi:hypothetical protein
MSKNPLGAPGFGGHLYYIDKGKLAGAGVEVAGSDAIKASLAETPHRIQLKNNLLASQERPPLSRVLKDPFGPIHGGIAPQDARWDESNLGRLIRGGESEVMARDHIPADAVRSRCHGLTYNGLRVAGAGLGAYGTYKSAKNLYNAWDYGAQTGNYEPLRHTAVVEGGGLAGGYTGAVWGAELGTFGGPWGIAAGGLAGGIGGALGGSVLADNWYNAFHPTGYQEPYESYQALQNKRANPGVLPGYCSPAMW